MPAQGWGSFVLVARKLLSQRAYKPHNGACCHFFEILFLIRRCATYLGAKHMALYSSKDMDSKTPSYTYGMARDSKCMTCGKEIADNGNRYSRRFCSEECRENYFF